jgi:transcriptional regulator with XRE-family HTH domain
MSSGRHPAPAAKARAKSLLAVVGNRLRDERMGRGQSLADVAGLAGVSRSAVAAAETGDRASLEMIVTLAGALRLDVNVGLVDRRHRAIRHERQADIVHSAMGELEVHQLGGYRFGTGIDEPYQHYQFSGRADVIAWDLDELALLHIENRTAFPDIQHSVGSYNAKRAYLAPAIAERLGIPGFRSETHIMACLWSGDVLHSLRIHGDTFRSVCPDTAERFQSWWAGSPPPGGRSSSLILLDPYARGRQRAWIDLETALASARPRVRNYAAAAALLRRRV